VKGKRLVGYQITCFFGGVGGGCRRCLGIPLLLVDRTWQAVTVPVPVVESEVLPVEAIMEYHDIAKPQRGGGTESQFGFG
jgi:hypothetical protein